MRRPLLFVCVCLFVLIALYMQFFESPFPGGEPIVPDGEKVYIRGQVYEKEYGQRDGREILIIYLEDILISRENIDSRQEIFQEKNQISDYKSKKKVKCEIYVSDLPCLKDDRVYLPCLGEWIEVSGEWRKFQEATNPGQFDQANYYAIEGIAGKLTDTQVLSKDGNSWILRERMYRLRQSLVERLYDIFESREASILAKMLLGDGSGLEPEIRELYQDNGIVHILSISGLHISLLGMGLYTLLRKLRIPLCGAAVTGGLFLVLYGMLTGFSVSACRAVGMYLIHMLGEIWGKIYDMLTAMGVLLVILLFDNPMLVYHSGFLLSFSSVCGVGLLGPILLKDRRVWMVRPYDSRLLKWIKRRAERISSGFWVSLSVTMFTMPLQLFFFYQLPVYSVFLNLLVIPFVGVVMVIGLMVLLMPGAVVLVPMESLIFDWFERCCRFFEKIPGHILRTGCPPFYKILIYYGVLLVGIFLSKRIGKRGVWGSLGVVALFLIITVKQDAQITFLDVGQGECICVQTTEGHCFLFDGGSGNVSNVGERIILPFLQYEGIDVVDGVFLSHSDADHINGIQQLLQEKDIYIKKVFLPDVEEREKEFEEILECVGNTQIQYVSQGMHLELSDLKIICLHPPKGFEGEDNSCSACFYLEINNTSFLLTGDIEGEGEEALVEVLKRREIGNVDILKVAHHGSRNATSEELLRQVNPGLAIISCGRDNRYGHPHEETLNRLADEGCMVLTTSERGAITVKVGDIQRAEAFWKAEGSPTGKRRSVLQ